MMEEPRNRNLKKIKLIISQLRSQTFPYQSSYWRKFDKKSSFKKLTDSFVHVQDYLLCNVEINILNFLFFIIFSNEIIWLTKVYLS
jgi:hypothetical protein